MYVSNDKSSNDPSKSGNPKANQVSGSTPGQQSTPPEEIKEPTNPMPPKKDDVTTPKVKS